MATRYNCTLRGVCEEDQEGVYATSAECQANCQGTESTDLLYEIYQYDPMLAIARGFAQSDQLEIIARLTGIRLQPQFYNLDFILKALAKRNWIKLASYPELIPYVATHVSELDMFWFKMLNTVVSVPIDWEELRPDLMDAFNDAFDEKDEFMEDLEVSIRQSEFNKYLMEQFVWVVFDAQPAISEMITGMDNGGVMRYVALDLIRLIVSHMDLLETEFAQPQ